MIVAALEAGAALPVDLILLGLALVLTLVGVIFRLVQVGRQREIEKNREIQLREHFFDLLLRTTDDIFILFSPDTFVAEYVSPNLERLLGLRPEEISGDVRLLWGEQQPDWDLPCGKICSVSREFFLRQTGEHRWFKEQLYHFTLDGLRRMILILSDRTAERDMNETLEQALSAAKAANEAKSNFLSNMSHDIRTPMNAVLGFATLLEKDAAQEEKVRYYTRKITASSQHLLSLINDILDMSKIESGKTSLSMVEFSLPQLVDELYTMMLPQARAKGQELDLLTRGSLPELLVGDRLRLNQVLINLLSNAVKYTGPDGHIQLSVQNLPPRREGTARLRFCVTDNGFGMSADFVKTIFDPFSREVTAATQEIQGTGLGMSITKNIVDLMGGAISVESKLGEGSTFSVTLEFPLADQVQDTAFWSRHHITHALVADDDPDVCQDIKERLAEVGVRADSAADGNEAAQLVAQAAGRQEPYPVILMDWKMPGLSGLETARLLRQNAGPAVPIFVLTAYDYDDVMEQARSVGVDLFLPKPFFLSNFQHALASLYEDQAEPALLPGEIELEGLHVLAAEDNEINAEILTELLDMEGVSCEIAHNGQQALERFQASGPDEFDVIFMDVQMPVMNGYEAAQAIRACAHPRAASIPILAMTANAFEEDVQHALDAGMNAHIAKPLDMDKLKDVLASLSITPQKRE